MNKKIIHLTAGGVLLGGAAIGFYTNNQKKKKDQIAHLLLEELERILEPSTAGIASEKAFQKGYKDSILKANPQKRILVFRHKTALKIAQQLESIWGIFFNGKEEAEKVGTLLKGLKDKLRISQVADAYLSLYGISLKTEFKRKLDEEHISIILAAIRPLAPFTEKPRT